MSQCWPLEGMTIAQKAVLISLADNANDQGVCWPSIATIAKRVCASERAVQNAIKWLEEAGALKTMRATGRSTSYTITPAAYAPPQETHPRTECTPAGNAPPNEVHHTPAGDAPHPRSKCGGPPQEMHPNRKEPSGEPKGNRQGARAERKKSLSLFDRFWQAYPRKAGKADAEKAFAKLNADDALLELLLAAIAEQAQWDAWREEGGKFIPHPATWLNGKRWTDQPPEAKAAPVGAPVAAVSADWWKSASGIESKAAELGVQHKAGEDFFRFKVRVMKRAGEGVWRRELLADLLRTKNTLYAGVHEYFYGAPPVEEAA